MKAIMVIIPDKKMVIAVRLPGLFSHLWYLSNLRMIGDMKVAINQDSHQLINMVSVSRGGHLGPSQKILIESASSTSTISQQ